MTEMAFNFDECPVQTCIVSRGFLYNYYDISPASGQYDHTLLLLHGHGDFTYGWRKVIPSLLAHNTRCIVPDMLGFGQTSKPVEIDAYKLKVMSDDMSELLKHAGVNANKISVRASSIVDAPVHTSAEKELDEGRGSQIVVVGHDWGSQLASRLALHHPTLVAACVSITGTYIPPMPEPLTLEAFTDKFPNFSYWHFFTSTRSHALLRTRMPIFWNTVVRTGRETAVPMSEIEPRLSKDDESTPDDWKTRPTLWDEESEARYLHAYLRGGWEAPMNWYRAFFRNYDDEKHLVANPRLQIPFLTILAENDPAVPVESAELSKAFLEKGELVVMPCGHWIGQEDGPGLGQLITDWLDRI